jgi:hypothetical protein
MLRRPVGFRVVTNRSLEVSLAISGDGQCCGPPFPGNFGGLAQDYVCNIDCSLQSRRWLNPMSGTGCGITDEINNVGFLGAHISFSQKKRVAWTMSVGAIERTLQIRNWIGFG